MSSRSSREGSSSVRAPRTPVGSMKKKSSGAGSNKKSAASSAAEPAAAAVHRRSSSGSSKKSKRSQSPEPTEAATSARKSLSSQGRSAEQAQADASARSASYVDPSLFPAKSRTASSASSATPVSDPVSSQPPPRLSRFSSRSRNGDESDAEEEEHPWKRMTREAERGELQIGFHNDQYIEDISVKSESQRHSEPAHLCNDCEPTVEIFSHRSLRLPLPRFLYKPHTITALLTVVGVLLFLAFRTETHPENWVSRRSA